MKRVSLLLAAGVIVAVSAAPARAQFRVIGYVPSWQGSNASIPFDQLTTVNYAFAIPNADGSLQPIENAAKLTDLVSRAHNANVKVVLSIGGWMGGNDAPFETLAANSTSRTTFVNACINVANQYGLDGIDIDWEYPDPGTSATNYNSLMSALCSAMHARSKTCSNAVVA